MESSNVILSKENIKIEFTFDDSIKISAMKAFEYFKFNNLTLKYKGSVYAIIQSMRFIENGVIVTIKLTDNFLGNTIKLAKIFNEIMFECKLEYKDYYRDLDIIEIQPIAIVK